MSHGTFWLVSDVRHGSLRAPGSGHQLEFPSPRCPFWLCNRRSLKAQVGYETLPANGIQAGTDFRPSRTCASLSDSESARLGRGAARPPGQFPIIYLTAVAIMHQPLSLQPAREAGKGAWTENPEVGPKQNLGRTF